jgi:hypothetical protein
MGYVDNPISSEKEDCFGFSRYRDALLRVVRSSGTPLTIGVFGPWGSGKTSLLKLLQEELPCQSGEDHWHPLSVWFNAWQYDRDEAIWRALILAVLDSMREGAEPDLAAELDRIEASLYRTVEWEELGKWTIDWAQALEGTVRGATQIALAFIPGATSLAKAVEEAWSQLRGQTTTAEQVEKVAKAIRQEVQNYRREQIRSLEQFQRDFAELVRKKVVEHNKRLVVFIDDLDRCLPEKAIAILETLKLFLSAEGCFFFLAADRDVIEKGIRVKYQDFLISATETSDETDTTSRIPITGRDYIEKIVQLPFSLPPLERKKVEQFIKEEYADLADCAPVCATGLEANPRKVKRTLNLLRLLVGLTEDTVNNALLAKIVVIQNRYSDLYANLFNYPRLLQELERHFLQSGDVLPPSERDYREQTLHDLRDRYITHRALGDMLCLEPFFRDLSREQLEGYLYLTRTISEDKRIIQTEVAATPLWDNLRSGDLTQIGDAVERIQAAGQSEQYVNQIAAMLEDTLLPWERLSLGLAWGMLGYPDDLNAWIQVPDSDSKLGKYPVANQQFRRFVESDGYEEPSYWGDEWQHVPMAKQPRYWNDVRWNQPTQPVVGISWYEARAYCRWLSAHKGQACRLPTEEEWARAATGNAELTPAHSGAGMDEISAYPWGAPFDLNRANTSESGLGVTTPAGCYPTGSSPTGFMDMSGNVWEWMADSGYRISSKAMRGGSWCDDSAKARWDVREDALPTFRSNFVGFRVLLYDLSEPTDTVER